jgi:molecular chaperone Hsp33
MGNEIRVIAASDSVLRALTDDGSFRVITARTTRTVDDVTGKQKAEGGNAVSLGDLVTATVLLRETMSPQLRVQGIARGAGSAGSTGSLVADSHPGGATRGLVQLATGHEQVRLGGGLLQMLRTLHDGRIQQGIVEIPPEGGVSAGLMRYMQTSEQIVAVVAVGTLLHAGRVIEAGGYVVQLLPEAREGMLAVMTERLADFPPIEDVLGSPAFTPSLLADELLYGMPYTRMEESSVRFECNCSQVRIIAGLSTLNSAEIQGLIAEGGTLDIACDFCHKGYQVSPEQLRGLLHSN